MIEVCKRLFLFVFVICLICASLEDLRYKMVRRFIWWPAKATGILLLLMQALRGSGADTFLYFELAGFVVLQFVFFSRMYGRADCCAFSCCSLVLTAWGGGLVEYLLHMLTAIIFLGVVQFFRKNINSKGNLKKPVAFIPYISASFITILLFQKSL